MMKQLFYFFLFQILIISCTHDNKKFPTITDYTKNSCQDTLIADAEVITHKNDTNETYSSSFIRDFVEKTTDTVINNIHIWTELKESKHIDDRVLEYDGSYTYGTIGRIMIKSNGRSIDRDTITYTRRKLWNRSGWIRNENKEENWFITSIYINSIRTDTVVIDIVLNKEDTDFSVIYRHIFTPSSDYLYLTDEDIYAGSDDWE